MAVNGLVHPQKIWKNVGALAGDQLILTKPLGSGVLFNANLKGWVSGKALDECIRQLVELNKTSAEILKKYQVHAVTDITGFGLAGHGLEMAQGSGVSFQINVENLPVFDEAFQMYEKGVSTGVNSSNRKLVENHIHYQDFLPAFKQEILFDPQTSGGLLASVPQHHSDEILRELHHSGMVEARVIGNVHPFEKNHINFT
jgi:selenide,water dikinase